MNNRWIPISLFLGLSLTYLSLSPGAISGMGYTMEEMRAGNGIIRKVDNLVHGISAPADIRWSRNGIVPVILNIPFLLIGEADASRNQFSQERVLGAEPVIDTALLLTIAFLWFRRLTKSQAVSFALALIAGFATFLWPYAYVGLETKQSLFVLLAGYLALASEAPRTWPRTVLFALVCACAANAKSTGAFVLPAVLFVVWCYFEGPVRTRLRNPGLWVVLAVVFLTFGVNSWFRSVFWSHVGGAQNFILGWMVRDPVSYFVNIVSFFGSPNKALLIFAPVTLICLGVLPAAYRTHRNLAIFALLTLGGLAGGFSLLTNWADETYGPRYLHSALIPLLLCFAAVYATLSRPARWAFYALALAGVYPSFVGALFRYGSLHEVQQFTRQNTLQALQGDIVWNHIRFDSRLFSIWAQRQWGLKPDPYWTPQHQWFYPPAPPGAPVDPKVDLSSWAHPQAVLLNAWNEELKGVAVVTWHIYFASLFVGLMLLVVAALEIGRERMGDPTVAAPRLLLPVVLTAGILVTAVFYFTDIPPDRANVYSSAMNSWKRLVGLPAQPAPK